MVDSSEEGLFLFLSLLLRSIDPPHRIDPILPPLLRAMQQLLKQGQTPSPALVDPDPPPDRDDAAASSATQALPSRNASSKYDFVKVKVWLGQNADHYYVLSRFLLSRMLSITNVQSFLSLCCFLLTLSINQSIAPFVCFNITHITCHTCRFLIMSPSRSPLSSRSCLSATAYLMWKDYHYTLFLITFMPFSFCCTLKVMLCMLHLPTIYPVFMLAF